MARKPERIIKAERDRIRRLLEDKEKNWKDKEIIDKLLISSATYYRHKKAIEKEDQETWQRKTQADKDLWEKLRTGPLERRALDILAAMEEGYSTCQKIIQDSEAPHAVQLEAAKWAVKFRVNTYYLLEKGPSPNMNVVKVKESINNAAEKIKQLEIGRSV